MEKEYLSTLNKEQLEAVKAIDGPMLIIAGAGTGKTKTLVSRVCYMLENRIAPESILLLTFTNKAADEMKERVVKAVGGETGSKILATTFHSFCNMFLRSYADLVGYKNDFIILGGEDSSDIIKMLLDNKKAELARSGKSVLSFPKANEIMKAYSMSTNDMIPVEDAAKSVSFDRDFIEITKEIIHKYDRYKKERNMMDYDDLLVNTALVLHNNEKIRAYNDAKYCYIMCDEYQDTNIIQDDILKQLSIDHCNLAVVGDDNQSIYKFRGAKIKNILTFDQRYQGCKVVVLFENYRSTQEILDLANAVMEHAKEGRKKTLKGQSNGEKPSIILYNNIYSEADGILEEVLRKNREGLRLKDMAVIIRATGSSVILEAKLNSEGIPYQKFGGTKFFQKRVVREIISFIRASLSDNDEIAWYLALNVYPQIGSIRGQEFAHKVSEEGMDSILDTKYSKYQYGESLKEMHITISHLREMKLKEQLDFLLNGYYEDLKTRMIQCSSMKPATKESEIAKLSMDIEEAKILKDLASKYDSSKAFIDEMILSQKEPETEGDYLNLTTIHSAKGLEYDTVFVMDTINGVFPRSKDDSEDDREELRCLYVALTRAKNHLYICLPKVYSVYGKPKEMELSHHMAFDDVMETCDGGEKMSRYFPIEKQSLWDFRW